MDDDQAIEQIASALRLYAKATPSAADSPRGIREWWLAELEPPPTADQVQQALLLLAAEGILIVELLPDGSELWRAAPRTQ